jgi:LysR family transcriptional regulator, regulator for metE and metH
MIEVKHFQLIKEIAETGSMTKAATNLFLTQPSLSHQLKEIESRLGVELFLRINKKMVLTPAGQKMLEASHEIITKIRQVEKELTNIEDSVRELRISTKCYTCYHWLPALMKQFHTQFPLVEFNIVTEAMSDPVDFLLKGKIDVAMVNSNKPENGITFQKLFDDEQVLVVHANHPLVSREFVTAKDFANEHLIIYKTETVDSDNFINSILKPDNIVPARITRMQLTEARIELVKAGLGVTVLSKWLVRPFLKGGSKLKLIRITRKGFYRSWFIAYLKQKQSDSYIKPFYEFLRAQDIFSKEVQKQ